MNGNLVDEIPANTPMTNEQIEKYLSPLATLTLEKLAQYKAPLPYCRRVFKKDGSNEYRIIPVFDTTQH